jgi:acyl-CoA synthetase (AMP-forming)/AMP-acid ligase II
LPLDSGVVDSLGSGAKPGPALAQDVRKTAPAGEPGELLIRGPQVMKGYLNNPQATAGTIDPDGWLHTGDLARVEPDGSTRIVDRLKELIKYKGYQIAPAELEALLLTHPAITDTAVIPIPDEEAGEMPKAFVVTDGSITSEEVLGFVAEHVAPYKKVRAIEMVEEIPKSPSGKILRRVLIERERDAVIAR